MYHYNCLLCEPGSKWNPPRPRYGSSGLIEIQEHVMREHSVTQQDLRQQTSVVISPGNYEYRLPDGRAWLSVMVN